VDDDLAITEQVGGAPMDYILLSAFQGTFDLLQVLP